MIARGLEFLLISQIVWSKVANMLLTVSYDIAAAWCIYAACQDVAAEMVNSLGFRVPDALGRY